MARPDLLPGILPALTPDTIAAVVRDICGYLATTDRPTSAAAKAMGRALATIRADQHQRLREASDSAITQVES